MSNKMSVKYGEDAGLITEATTDTSVVVFIVKDDDGKEVGRMEVDGNELPADNQQRAYLYGINKLLTDRTSDIKDKREKLDQMNIVFELLVSGEWSKERVVGAIVVSVEVEALAQIKELSVPQAQAALAAYDKDVRAQILGSEAVQEAAAALRLLRSEMEVRSLDDMIPEA